MRFLLPQSTPNRSTLSRKTAAFTTHYATHALSCPFFEIQPTVESMNHVPTLEPPGCERTYGTLVVCNDARRAGTTGTCPHSKAHDGDSRRSSGRTTRGLARSLLCLLLSTRRNLETFFLPTHAPLSKGGVTSNPHDLEESSGRSYSRSPSPWGTRASPPGCLRRLPTELPTLFDGRHGTNGARRTNDIDSTVTRRESW